MTRPSLMRAAGAALSFVAAALAGPVCAQQFPTRPVTMVVPYAAGGSADVLGRVLAVEMGKALGENVIVELKPGAGGNVGAEFVARQARPDGYTFLFASVSLATSVSLQKLNFDPRKDLVAVAGIAAIPSLLVVSAESPHQGVRDIVEAARGKPGAVTFGSSGPATGSHLAGELLGAMANVQMTHVPYKGSGAVYPDLIAQRVTFLIDVMGSSSGQVKGGKVRALGVTSAKRVASFPDVPTIAEQGFPGYSFDTWFGFFVPAGTPADAIARLEQASLKALQSDAVKERFAQSAAEPVPGPGAEFAKYYATDVERWAKLVREGKIAPLQ